MSPHLTHARGGLVASALARAEAWLLEPVEAAGEETAPAPIAPRPVVAVFGLGPACGATVVARALAAELGARADGSAAVSAGAASATLPLAAPAASRLARALATLPQARTRAVGRLCLIECPDQLALAEAARHLAPLVLDAGREALGGVPTTLADRTVLVATPRVEPALASAAAACLRRVGAEPIVVVNRATPDERWTSLPALELPESRVAAQLALGGREPRGELGHAIAELADVCESW